MNKADLEPTAVLADGFDDAIIGTDIDGRVIYSVDQCMAILVQRDGMAPGEAQEFLEFNTIGAYFGPMSPIFLYGVL